MDRTVLFQDALDSFGVHTRKNPVRYPLMSGGLHSPLTTPLSHSSSVSRLYHDRDVSVEGSDFLPRVHSTSAVRNDSGSKTNVNEDPTAIQLQVQIGVNKELKRLLVASVGSDLQVRLEQIVQEKAELTRDLDTSLQQLAENREDFDHVSIECDIWRSKFLASRVMIDELAGWKAELLLHFKESLKALQCLLNEREELAKESVRCHSQLLELSDKLQQSTMHPFLQSKQTNTAVSGPPSYGDEKATAATFVQYPHNGED